MHKYKEVLKRRKTHSKCHGEKTSKEGIRIIEKITRNIKREKIIDIDK